MSLASIAVASLIFVLLNALFVASRYLGRNQRIIVIDRRLGREMEALFESDLEQSVEIDAAAINRRLVLENDVVFGTVNANRRHYTAAVAALATADPSWLDALITRRVALEGWAAALDKRPDDVKVVLHVGS